ncbi:TonB-dependent receptor [Erythrobacter alti]|uniref:TonB-dependent receptor n=1 Tax=Erythrobacter alti TaxID=1896145 RepID=UPI0030F496F2
MGYWFGAGRAGIRPVRLASQLLAGTAIAVLAIPAAAQAQDQSEQSDQADSDSNTIVVSGIRATIQDSISTKRDNDLIIDALSSDEIGDLPALSIGEALETLTGAGSHREQGGATEISIRGLGPFLGSTVINGRAASNGSGDRSVNFSQFPSELFSTVGIYKTQSASLIEGGVAGQIVLETVRPLDYGRTRIQGELKVNYNPQNFDIDEDQRFQDLGYRGTVSYVDQYELGDFGELGISLGFSRNEQTNPEQEANVSNTVNYCLNDPSNTSVGVYDDNNCDSPRPSMAGTEDFVIAQNSYSYRQNITDDTRDAIFAALQYQPSPTADINIDFQHSKRTFREMRNDLNFSEGRRIDGANEVNTNTFIPGYPLIVGEFGDLLQFTGETSVETNSEYLVRSEEYYGGGISLDLELGDRLTVGTDVSYSETQRIETGVQIRQRIRDQLDIFGNPAGYPRARESDFTNPNSNSNTSDDRIETAYLIRQNGSETLNFVVQEFDPNRHDLFRDNARLRNDLEQDRFNSILAVRADASYEMDGFFSSFEAGGRYQRLIYRDVPGAATGTSRFENVYSNAALATANQECRTPFPESGFMSSVNGGNDLITIVDTSGNVIGSTNTFATFNAICLAQVLERENPTGQLSFDEDGVAVAPSGDFDSIQNSDVTEHTYAGYLQANFESAIGDTPIRGNLGVRVIRTDVASRGFRGQLNAVFDGTTGELTDIVEDQSSLSTVVGESSYTTVLPSFNLTAELTPDLLGRVAVFRALSRPDPSNLGYGRTFNALVDDGSPVFSVADAVGTANATGNPFTDPLLSWNFDAALEWYPDPDSILAVGGYYKSFNGGFETIGRFETFTVDGQDLETLVTTVNTSDDTSTIYGVEVTASHRLSYLPQPLDGLGFKVSYNFADTDFEFQDDTLGAITTVNADGSTSVSEALIPPAGLFGFSRHVLSAQAFYEIGNLELQGVYKYRSRYFQQFVSTPGRVRYTDDTGVFEARISYALNRNVRFSLEGLNLFDEPRTDLRPTEDGFSAISVYGPRYYAGVRVRF